MLIHKKRVQELKWQLRSMSNEGSDATPHSNMSTGDGLSPYGHIIVGLQVLPFFCTPLFNSAPLRTITRLMQPPLPQTHQRKRRYVVAFTAALIHARAIRSTVSVDLLALTTLISPGSFALQT